MTTHRVYYRGGEQPIRTILHLQGRPLRVDAATYAIVDTRHPESSTDHELVAAGTAADVDAVSTTLTARAGRGAVDRRVLIVHNTAGAEVGHSYLLESTDGKAELVRIAAVASGTQLLAAAEIAGDYYAGAALRGVEIAALFPASAADDDENLDDMPWVVVWSAAGAPPTRESIHLHRGEEGQLATLDDLRNLDPALANLGGDRHELALALSQAHTDFRVDLALAGASESDYLTGPIGQSAVVYRAAELALAGLRDEAVVRRAEGYGRRYQEIRAALQVGKKKPEVVTLTKPDVVATRINPASLFVPL